MIRKQALVKVFAGVVLVTTAAGSFEVRAGEEKRVPEAPAPAVALDALPEAVRRIALAEAKQTPIKGITGAYEVVLTNGQRIRIRVDGTGVASLIRADDPLGGLPDHVRTVIQKEAKGERLIGVNTETRIVGSGKRQTVVTRYRASWAGKAWKAGRIEVDPDGKVTRLSVRGLKLEEVPAAVKATILKQGLGAQRLRIDLVRSGDTRFYQVHTPRGALDVDPNGKVLRPLPKQRKTDEPEKPGGKGEF